MKEAATSRGDSSLETISSSSH